MSNSQNQFSASSSLKWLFFDLNSYFASVEQQDRPELRGRPVAVIPSDTDYTSAIAASHEAKAYGIKTGTKIFEAKKLCPDLVCVLARHNVYVEYHHRIFAEVEKHVPITKKCSIDEAACQLLKNEQSREAATKIAQSIKAGLKQNIGPYIRCSIGIAPNMFLAKTASDIQKIDGLVILEPHRYKEELFKLKLNKLCGIGFNMERRLNRAGIYTIEQLWNIQPKHARKIWNSVEGETFWYKLHGYEVPEKVTQKRMIGHTRVLDPEFRPSDKAYDIALNLTVKACARLRRCDLFARRFTLSIKTADKRYWTMERSLMATQDSFDITAVLKEIWSIMQRETHHARLARLSVMLYDLFKKEDITLDLFDVANANASAQKTTEIGQSLSLAMDAINQKYGANCVNLGVCPKTSAGFVGTKVAFNRIPDLEEFME